MTREKENKSRTRKRRGERGREMTLFMCLGGIESVINTSRGLRESSGLSKVLSEGWWERRRRKRKHVAERERERKKKRD